jgi:predicted DNA-binding transcriptional regulator YafY
MRKAIRTERMVQLTYGDVNGSISTRRIWPFALGYFDNSRIIMAWCELRQDFRHFRADRIVDFAVLEARYPRRRVALAREWHAREGVVHN